MIRKVLTAGVSLSVAATGLLMASPSQATITTAAAGSTLTATHFAMEASGYSTRLKGGDVPASSDRSAFQVIACTNLAGKNKTNTELSADVTPLISTKDAATRVWTTQQNGVVSSWARNKIASVTLGNSTTPTTATINGITSLSRAYHDATGFHASTKTTVLSIDPDGSGPLPAVDGPTAGAPVQVPGVAVISVGPRRKSADANGAFAEADALRVKIIPTGTVAFFAHSRATINGGVVSGIFTGSAYASRATALGGRVKSGKTPYIVMPCQGTGGQVIRKDIARVNPKVIVNGVVAKGLHADQSADQTRMKAAGYERGRVDRLRIGEGTSRVLAVSGIVGRANVQFVRGQGITTNVKGSKVLGVTLNGDAQRFGSDGVIRIANLAKLEQHIVKRTKLTIQITELRVTLLGGTNDGTVIDLGVAKVGFNRAGL